MGPLTPGVANFSFKICPTNAPCTQPVFKTDEQEGIATLQEDVLKEAKLRTYPNPFSDNLNIEFTLPEDSKVKLEVFNVAGQRLSLLFEGEVKGNELHKVEFTPAASCDCMIVYRLQTEQGTYYGKAVMTR